MAAKNCGIVWAVYLIAFNFYIATYKLIGVATGKLIYFSASLFLLIYLIIDLIKGIENDLHKGFFCLCLSAIAINFLFMAIYWGIGVDDYKFKFCTFNSIELLTACFVLHSGYKHGLFKNETTLP